MFVFIKWLAESARARLSLQKKIRFSKPVCNSIIVSNCLSRCYLSCLDYSVRSARRLHRTPLPRMRLELCLELDNKSEYTRNISLPFATREASTFLKLLQYDLAAHPPNAPIVGVYLTATPVHPRVVQGGLFIPLAPEPEKLELTLARITAIVGEGNVGTPELLDTHRPGVFRMTRFHAKQAEVPRSIECAEPRLAIRIYRPPLPANVVTQRGRPAKVAARGVSGVVTAYAGPWRTSGDWIAQDSWEHDEWDVALQSGGVYRLRRLAMNQWLIDGNYD